MRSCCSGHPRRRVPRAPRLGASAAIPWRSWAWLTVGVLPAIVGFFAYNQVRFGTPLESGYALATLPPFLEANREKGLFSLAHVPMNLDYFLAPPPDPDPDVPVLQAGRTRACPS